MILYYNKNKPSLMLVQNCDIIIKFIPESIIINDTIYYTYVHKNKVNGKCDYYTQKELEELINDYRRDRTQTPLIRWLR